MQHHRSSVLIALLLLPMLCLALAAPASAAPGSVGSTVASWLDAVLEVVDSWSTPDPKAAEESLDEGGLDIEPNG